MRGVQDESADEYLPLLMDTAEDVQREKQYFRLLTTQPVCGVIVGGSRIASEELAAAISHQKIPMVVLNRPVRHPHVACFMVDFQVATYRATCHLLSLNHTRICVSGGTRYSRKRRRPGGEALRRALSEAGLPFRPELCPVSFPGVDGGFQAMSALLTLPASERPTAVVAYNDLMALGALHAIRVHHLHVPEDISVIGIDDICDGRAHQSAADHHRAAQVSHGPRGDADFAADDSRPAAARRRLHFDGKSADRARIDRPGSGQ